MGGSTGQVLPAANSSDANGLRGCTGAGSTHPLAKICFSLGKLPVNHNELGGEGTRPL
jgi:hypothetical protein